jgi:hypothetical protein
MRRDPAGNNPRRQHVISDFRGKTAVLTGAGSGFGLECARIGARLGMNLVLVDVQPTRSTRPRPS